MERIPQKPELEVPMIFVKPAKEGIFVRHPENISHKLKPEGEFVVDNIQWQRYIRHGDVVISKPGHVENKPSAKNEKHPEKPFKQGA